MNKSSKITRSSSAFKSPIQFVVILVSFSALFCSCHYAWHYIPLKFDEAEVPPKPDYSLAENWAALPSKVDNADLIPSGPFENRQMNSEVDCFYIHPTGFLEKDDNWNADVSNSEINEWTDNWPLKHQASAFNGSCKIYAPRYRQAHMKSFFHLQEGGKEALALAYQDVARAFQFYLENYNSGRPFILAAHSQGTTHAQLLIKQFVDGTELQDRMVCAYLVGMPTKLNEFKSVPSCKTSHDCGCFNSWTTFDKGYYPDFYNKDYASCAVINPTNWTAAQDEPSSVEFHKGILVSSFKLKYAQSLEAQIHHGLLWVSKPQVPVLKHFVLENNWHKADYNLFWVNVRENVQDRIEAFLTLNQEDPTIH